MPSSINKVQQGHNPNSTLEGYSTWVHTSRDKSHKTARTLVPEARAIGTFSIDRLGVQRSVRRSGEKILNI